MPEHSTRGRLKLALVKITPLKPINRNGVEIEFWRYDFKSADGEAYTYAGKRYALFIGRTYDVTATIMKERNRYGDRLIKNPRWKVDNEAPLLL